jgi:O-acetyl-ADP-ribose deacetylase (regulator of RNase III)
MAHIRYERGSIFDSKAHVIVNTVNCEGFMGKGLALAFKQRYPDMFAVYQEECKSHRLRIGRPTLYKETTPWILNFPTKNKWRANSKLEYLEKGLKYLITYYKKAGIKSIAFPKLGAQNGKLSWDEVGPLMAKYLSQLDIDVYIYIAEGDQEYQYDPQRENDIREKIWKQFSELALSQDHLVQEVQLSPREAKKVAQKRESLEIASLADIESIGLAKISLKKIKNYICCQEFTKVELEGMSSASVTKPQAAKKASRSRSTKRNQKKPMTTDKKAPVETLFPVRGLAG